MSNKKNRIRIRTSLDSPFEVTRAKRFRALSPADRIKELLILISETQKITNNTNTCISRKPAVLTIKKK